MKKGCKPDFHQAMGTDLARAAFSECVDAFKRLYKAEKIATGSF